MFSNPPKPPLEKVENMYPVMKRRIPSFIKRDEEGTMMLVLN
jgi:hypothetical protein